MSVLFVKKPKQSKATSNLVFTVLITWTYCAYYRLLLFVYFLDLFDTYTFGFILTVFIHCGISVPGMIPNSDLTYTDKEQ